MTNTASLLGSLRGTVLELGPGYGGNLRHLDPDVHWIGVEPQTRRHEVLRRSAERLRSAELLPGRAERLDLPDSSVDAAVGTYVLCSIRNPEAALVELRRVLRPGGRYVFAEHVAAPHGTALRAAQHVWSAVTHTFGVRCRPDRDSGDALVRAGFEVVSLHHSTLPGPLGTGVPHLSGVVRRPLAEEKP